MSHRVIDPRVNVTEVNVAKPCSLFCPFRPESPLQNIIMCPLKSHGQGPVDWCGRENESVHGGSSDVKYFVPSKTGPVSQGQVVICASSWDEGLGCFWKSHNSLWGYWDVPLLSLPSKSSYSSSSKRSTVFNDTLAKKQKQESKQQPKKIIKNLLRAEAESSLFERQKVSWV